MLVKLLAFGALIALGGATSQGSVTEVTSFSVPQSPSGLFYYSTQDLLYVLCGTRTNGDHQLYAFTPEGTQQCAMTIPTSAGMSRVDGFYILDDKAYIVDSQGPIYASEEGKLGGSIYVVEWSNPCGCGTDGTCTTATTTWTPTVTAKITIDAKAPSIDDGNTNDLFFRNSGIVVKDSYIYAVNGVHPSPTLTEAYPKSIVKIAANDTAAAATAVQKWSFTASELGHDVDMEGLTCGSDGCATHLYVGDEYNYIYELELGTADPAAAVTTEWNLKSIVGDVPDDKGIEALTYSSKSGHFYAGIQETAKIHVVSLSHDAAAPVPQGSGADTGEPSPDAPVIGATYDPQCGATLSDSTSLATCASSIDYPACRAPQAASQRVRREMRTLTPVEWKRVVDAFWIIKNTTTADGAAKYGSAFKTYDYFVLKHAVAQLDIRGDQAHFGPMFMTWHSAFVLEFEECLLAVDPLILALPYWDNTKTSPTAFDTTYFGSDPAATSTTKEVVDGPFAYWPVTSDFNMSMYTQYMDNESLNGYTLPAGGWLRGTSNTLTNKFSTRYGSGTNTETRNSYPADGWWACTALVDWPTWWACMEGVYHSGPHGGIGGTSGTNRGDFEDPATSPNGPIFFFHHANVDRNKAWWMHVQQDTKCSYFGYPVTGAVTISAGGGGPGGPGGGEGPPGGGEGPPGGGPRHAGASAIGRKRRGAKATARRQSSYEGMNLNEPLASVWGFTAGELGITHTSAPTGLFTHADTICWLNPSSAVYTYDTHSACLPDATSCCCATCTCDYPAGTLTGCAASVVNTEKSATTSAEDGSDSDFPVALVVAIVAAVVVVAAVVAAAAAFYVTKVKGKLHATPTFDPEG